MTLPAVVSFVPASEFSPSDGVKYGLTRLDIAMRIRALSAWRDALLRETRLPALQQTLSLGLVIVVEVAMPPHFHRFSRFSVRARGVFPYFLRFALAPCTARAFAHPVLMHRLERLAHA